ncbi:MAG: hypothetical protein ACXWTT_00875 [Methylobacter sp.]
MTGLEKSKAITEIIKGIAEIVALIVAGLWAFSNFQETEKPSLEPHAHSESVMAWFPSPDPNHCLGSFGISIKNSGKKAINLDKASLHVWIIDQPPFEKKVTYLDPEQFQSKQAIYDKTFIAGEDRLGLLGHFSPNTEAQTDFTFDFGKQSLKIALFSFEAYGPDVKIRQRRWSYVCDLPDIVKK